MSKYQHSDLGAAFQNILSPATTAFLIIDHQAAFASCFEALDLSKSEKAICALIGAARDLDIPVIASVVETNRITPDLNPLVLRLSDNMNIIGRCVANPWESPAFSAAVTTANKPKLLIAGLSAESSLSLTALGALEQGFDVFIVGDASLGFSSETVETSFERLKQAGAVIVSWRQVMTEWHQGDIDPKLIKRVLKPQRSVDRET